MIWLSGIPIRSTACAALTGFGMLCASLLRLRSAGREGRSAAGPAAGIAAGSLLLSFRAVTDMLTESLFNASAPEGLATVETGPGPYADMVRLALVIVMLVGFYQIAKGLVLLKRSAEGGDCFWRAVTHIAGGTLCVNIRQFMLVLGSSAGGVLRDVVTRLLGSRTGKRRFFMRFFRHLFHTLAAPVLLMPCATARAAGSLGDMSDSVRGEIAKFGPALKAGFALAGFFLVGLGLWQLYSLSQQPGRPKGGALMAIVIGACLLAAATIAQMTSGSLSAGDPELNAIGL